MVVYLSQQKTIPENNCSQIDVIKVNLKIAVHTVSGSHKYNVVQSLERYGRTNDGDLLPCHVQSLNVSENRNNTLR